MGGTISVLRMLPFRLISGGRKQLSDKEVLVSICYGGQGLEVGGKHTPCTSEPHELVASSPLKHLQRAGGHNLLGLSICD